MAAETSIEGFYLAYLTGADDNGLIMFVITDGQIIGADALGVKLDGTYVPTADAKGFDATIKITAPAEGTLVQGVTTGPKGITYEVKTVLPPDLESVDYLKIPTQFGSINARFKKLRGLKNA